MFSGIYKNTKYIENKISKLEFPVGEPGNSSIIYTKDVENKIKC